MIKLALKEFQRRIFTNIFTALQLGIIIAILISVVSALQSRFVLYTPVKDMIEKNGAYVYVNFKDLFTEEEINEEFKGIDDILCSYIPDAFFQDFATDRTYTNIKNLSYKESLIESYQPKLKEGKWLSDVDLSDDIIYTVVYDCKNEYNVGDTFEMEHFYYLPEDTDFSNPVIEKFPVKIIGIINDDSLVFGLSGGLSEVDDYRNLYGTVKDENYSFVSIFSKSQLESKGITCGPRGTALITYSDNLSDEDCKILTSNITKQSATIDMETFRERSIGYVYNQLFKMIPLLICVAMLVVVSTVSISALNVKGSLKAYSIFYVCGSDRTQCLNICLINSILTALMGVAIAVILMNIGSVFGILEETVIETSASGILACIVALMLQIACSMIMPIILMNKCSLKENLTENE